MTIRVFIADDHGVVRVGLKQVLTELGGFEVIGEATDGRQVLNAADLGRADVLVLDLSLPIVNGVEVLRRVRRKHPTLPVVVHSMHPEDQFAARVLKGGAAAYVSKERPPGDLVLAVERAARGLVEAPEADEADAAAPHTTLTAREHQVFMRLVSGLPVADIAAELDVHSCTVSNHLANVRRKLGRHSVADLVAYALAEGLLDAPPPTD
ncbi:MAG: response regulator transcription factor [Myxococcales bacterium]|nr:response regulator transcription factor [Myxococcales bacterium]MCB9737467.1 response regulator transcription factor [Deltaproteobacteria bacterium]